MLFINPAKFARRPTNPLGARNRIRHVLLPLALLAIVDSQPLDAGRASQFTVNPSSISFGSVPVGTVQTQYATVSNTGSSSVTISRTNVTGTGFSVGGLNLPLPLASGQSVKLSVGFGPPAGGTYSGTLSLTSLYRHEQYSQAFPSPDHNHHTGRRSRGSCLRHDTFSFEWHATLYFLGCY